MRPRAGRPLHACLGKRRHQRSSEAHNRLGETSERRPRSDYFHEREKETLAGLGREGHRQGEPRVERNRSL